MKKYYRFINEDKDNLEEQAITRIKKAFAMIMAQWPFIADILIRLKIRVYPCQTMATDGVHLLISPEFAMSLSEAELNFVLCHEVLHNAFFHFARQDYRDAELWNWAADYAINLLLQDMGKYCKMPEGCLLDSRFENMRAEEIYDILEKEGKKGKGKGGDGSGDGSGDGGPGGGPPGTGKDVYKPGDLAGKGEPIFGDSEPKGPASYDPDQVKKEITETMKASANAGRTAGQGGGALDRFIKGLNKPKVNWKEELKDFVSRVYDKAKIVLPTRRSLWSNQALSGLKRYTSDTFNDMVVAIDTSGSIGDEELDKFATEIGAIMQDFEIETIHIIWCDDHIAGVQTFEDYDFQLHKMKAKGGGGTSFIPPFKWVNKNLIEQGKDPAVMIYFTDSFGQAPNANMLQGDLEERLLWVIIGADSADNIQVGKKIFVDKII